MTEYLAKAVGASKHYGDVVALDAMDLDIPAGQLVGLLGPNGAGKTTLISLLTGLRRPTAGRVELFGGDPRKPANRIALGSTPQQTGLPETLRVREVVEFVAGHYPDPRPTGELLEEFGLTASANKQTGALSGGQQRRLTVALAFIGRPRLVVLDEPTTGLDVDGRHALWEALRRYHATGGTLLLTSHYLEEVEALAERVVVIDQGRVLADDSLNAIRSKVATSRIELRCAELPELPGVLRREETEDRIRLFTQDPDQLVRDLVHSGAAFRDLQISTTSLEEAFVALTSKAAPTESNLTASGDLR
ncbi:ABC transporter ATP-binding protein [Actinoalloteichus hymeniacidonis]|uniref:ABC-type multidrug transport system, ATPase component n=1 Tax=Actinoalloteichus hymeniacidonis TaxID=340345 RepID=A0AAC9HUL0_9PSEU|nr:ABC transporter ATP-binding protein [Actinoalloteichus hymeniacidonis]AOS65650.1 ABC-type multidrug transport system, ATPase component [Actinoalloteichus hymeniacidonis]MBB5906260.1 ABC-2 type transport system ATP-binding protein [Actinoalloteichus hymeniacidonis]